MKRSEIMQFFRENDEDNINTLSIDDRYELIIALCAHSDELEARIHDVIVNFEY